MFRGTSAERVSRRIAREGRRGMAPSGSKASSLLCVDSRLTAISVMFSSLPRPSAESHMLVQISLLSVKNRIVLSLICGCVIVVNLVASRCTMLHRAHVQGFGGVLANNCTVLLHSHAYPQPRLDHSACQRRMASVFFFFRIQNSSDNFACTLAREPQFC